MHGPDVSLIVLTYNRWDRTREFLESLRASGDDYSSTEFLWVDNASSDDTVLEMRRWLRNHPLFHSVVAHVNAANRGFLRGVNQAVCHARAGVVALVNNDVVVTPFWFRHLRDGLRAAEVGAIGPVSDGMPWQQSLRHKGRGIREVPTLYGFCIFARRSLFESVGLLDLRYGRGVAEVEDWCERVRRAGVRLVVDTCVLVRHPEPHASYTPRVNALLTARNRELFERKWGRGPFQWGDRSGPARVFARTIVCQGPAQEHVHELLRSASSEDEILAIRTRDDDSATWIRTIRGDERLHLVLVPTGQVVLPSLMAANARGSQWQVCPFCEGEKRAGVA